MSGNGERVLGVDGKFYNPLVDKKRHEREVEQLKVSEKFNQTKQLMEENMKLKEDCAHLKNTVVGLSEKCELLTKENANVKSEGMRLAKEVDALTAKLTAKK